ncbi:MAG: hypothetical protein LBR17_05545 [Bacteroidales bacterium]|jgi:aspartyl protease family protein|nr:hypothetical protein [Bacteroidales bacterium]
MKKRKQFIVVITLLCLPFMVMTQVKIKMNKVVNSFVFPYSSINGLNVNGFVFDTGADEVLISETEFNFMLAHGYISQSDIGVSRLYTVAGGNSMECKTVSLREIRIMNSEGDTIKLYNVKAGVAPAGKISADYPQASLLFGQTAIQQAGDYNFSYSEGGVLTFKNQKSNTVAELKEEAKPNEPKEEQKVERKFRESVDNLRYKIDYVYKGNVRRSSKYNYEEYDNSFNIVRKGMRHTGTNLYDYLNINNWYVAAFGAYCDLDQYFEYNKYGDVTKHVSYNYFESNKFDSMVCIYAYDSLIDVAIVEKLQTEDIKDNIKGGYEHSICRWYFKQMKVSFYLDGFLQSGYIRNFEYNDKGYCTKEYSENIDGENKEFYTYLYLYDEKGNVIKKNGLRGSEQYKYNTNNNMVEKTCFYDDDTPRHYYKYNVDGKLIKESAYSGNDKVYWTRIYYYDELGNLRKTTSEFEQGSKTIHLYKYDEQNRLIGEVHYDNTL